MDKGIDQNSVVVDAEIDGRCRMHFFVSNCDITPRFRDAQQICEIKRYFMFLDAKGDDFQVIAVADRDDLSQVTLDLEIEKLNNRVFTLAIVAGIFFLLAFLNMLHFIQIRPVAALRKGMAFVGRAVVVQIPRSTDGKSVRYIWNDNGVKRVFSSRFDKKERAPFLLGSSDAKTFDALAVVPEGRHTSG